MFIVDELAGSDDLLIDGSEGATRSRCCGCPRASGCGWETVGAPSPKATW
ncbi:hypothetical protein [Blastococcus brunescens]|uniref:Uncharacterized protein n=1 Tax=Blastococcus brunescens TaxID=1564165 RepID=A0ABZ1B979_9ACTN|nr:hypothetical protein [Blastococcus sp. BMG 8361]WRL67359.1 hypothetical protein U6N30_08280 [Blastococcus sp. BMG 8361]